MFGMGMPELILIFVVVLVLFGPNKLPELGRTIGTAMREFKKASEDWNREIKQGLEGEGKSDEKHHG